MDKLNRMIDRYKTKLIALLAGKEGVMMNLTINAEGIKDGYIVVATNYYDEYAVINSTKNKVTHDRH